MIGNSNFRLVSIQTLIFNVSLLNLNLIIKGWSIFVLLDWWIEADVGFLSLDCTLWLLFDLRFHNEKDHNKK